MSGEPKTIIELERLSAIRRVLPMVTTVGTLFSAGLCNCGVMALTELVPLEEPMEELCCCCWGCAAEVPPVAPLLPRALLWSFCAWSSSSLPCARAVSIAGRMSCAST